MNFEGKIALVTGSGRGIGKAIVADLSKRGATVIVADRNGENAEATCNEIRESGATAMPITADVSVLAEAEGMVNKVLAEFGRIDILINNAGWDDPMPFLNKTHELCDKLIDINLKSTINCCKLVAPHMMEQGGGKIVNTGSDAGRVGIEGESVYSAAKAGVMALTKALAKELAPTINVNSVSPAMIYTPLTEEVLNKVDKETLRVFEQEMRDSIPLKRWGRPEEIATAFVYLSSDLASYITGQVLSVNGGLYMVD